MTSDTLDNTAESIRAQILQRVISAVSDVYEVDEKELSESTHFMNDLDADALDVIETIMEIEDEFDIELTDEHAAGIQTIGQAVDVVMLYSRAESANVTES